MASLFFNKKMFLYIFLTLCCTNQTIQTKVEIPDYLKNLDTLQKKCFTELPEERFLKRDHINYEEYKGQASYFFHKNFQSSRANPFIPSKVIQKIIKKYIKKYCSEAEIKKNSDYAYLEKNKIFPQSKICIIGDIHGSFIIGDIHGSFHSLLRILTDLEKKSLLSNKFKINSDDFCIVFTGDNSDRGLYGTEVWYTLLTLKLNNWNQVFLLRGNHETKKINLIQNPDVSNEKVSLSQIDSTQNFKLDLSFEAEIFSKYKNNSKIFKKFCNLYNYLPVGLYLGCEQELDQSWVLFSHGGLDPKFDSKVFIENEARILTMKDFLKLNHLRTTLNKKIINTIIKHWIWSDFYLDVTTISIQMINRPTKKIKDLITPKYLKKRKIKAFFRGHQHHTSGLKIFTTEMIESLEWDKATPRKGPNSGINISKHIPIFTFSTATEWEMVPKAFYGILETAENFDDWRLYPNEIELKNSLS